MANDTTLNKIMGTFPSVEMLVRRIYRSSYFNRYLKKSRKKKKTAAATSSFDFAHITDYLRSIGVQEGDILIVHSAYRPLRPTGLKPEEIVLALKSVVGTDGTLVMPVIRQYPESPPDEAALTADITDITFTYDVAASKVWTGAIPTALMRMNDSLTSRFPLNTVCALGPAAPLMIKKNLEGELPAPNGINSPWKYCTDQNAWVVSIGTDLTHSLTMIHTAEDVQKEQWPVKNWYRKKHFVIIDGNFRTEKTVLERHPRWGMLHFGERKLASDLINNGILHSEKIGPVLVESLRAKTLYDFLNANNQEGYPYFWLGGHLKK